MKRFARRRVTLALDAGTDSFKLAVAGGVGRGTYVSDVAECAPTEDALRTLVAERGWQGSPVRLIAQEPELIWRPGFAPKLARRLQTSTLELETRKIAAVDMESCHWNYRPMTAAPKGEDGRLQFQVAVARAETTNRLVSLARAAGLEPASILPLPEALRETVEAAQSQEHAVALLDCGAQQTRVVILHRGEPVLCRTLGVGGRQLTEALLTVMAPRQPAFTFSPAEAEALKRRHGLLHEPVSAETEEVLRGGQPARLPLAQVSEALRPFLERLVRELYSTVEFWRERFFDVPFGEVRLTGGGALLPGLPEYLATVLGVPVGLVAPPVLVGMEQSRAIPAGAVCGALVAPLTAINLLDPCPATSLELTGRWLTTSRVAAVLMLTLGLGLAGGLWRVRSEEHGVKGAQAKLNGQEARADLLRVAAGVRGQVEKSIALRSALTAGAPDWPAILAGLSRQVLPEARLTSLDVDAAATETGPSAPRLRLSGIVTGSDSSPQILARLLSSLQDVPGIGPTELVSAALNDDGNEAFEIRSTLLNGGLR